MNTLEQDLTWNIHDIMYIVHCTSYMSEKHDQKPTKFFIIDITHECNWVFGGERVRTDQAAFRSNRTDK